jgi:hypothetical protein
MIREESAVFRLLHLIRLYIKGILFFIQITVAFGSTLLHDLRL